MKKILAAILLAPISVLAADLTAFGLPTVPVKTTTLTRDAYVVQHYDACKAPITSSEHLTKAALGGHFPRDPFVTDPDLPKTAASTPGDYTDTGFDRGHLSPAEDFASGVDTMHESFYMSNIVPQRPKNNRALWRSLEMRVRKFVKSNDDLYIITGAVFNDHPDKIGSGVCVPTYMFKVLIDKTAGTSVGFLVPNTDEAASQRFTAYAVPISEIEKASHINFTPQLSGNTIDKTKVTLNLMK